MSEQGRGPGRPRAVNDENRGHIITFLAAGASMRRCGEHFDIDERTIRREMERDHDFARRVREARGKVETKALAKIVGLIDSSNHVVAMRAAAWFLERVNPRDWGNLRNAEDKDLIVRIERAPLPSGVQVEPSRNGEV